MKSSWVVKPVCVAIWMMGHVGAASAAEVVVSKDVIRNAIAQNDDKTLPTVDVTADAPAEMSDVHEAQPPVGRKDLDPDSIQNPYRVETSGRFGSEVFTQKEIQAIHPKDLYDLLDKATGLDLTYQGRKSPYFLNERGGGSMTYILDGALLPTQQNRILQSIPLAAIEQIQVVRGSTSLTLGPSINYGSSNSPSGLNTGFVVIRTKRPAQTEARASVSVEKAVSQPTTNRENLYLGTHLGEEDQVNGYLGGALSRTDIPSKDTWFDGQEDSTKMATGGVSFGKFSINGMAYKSRAGFEMQRGVTNTGALDSSKWYYDPLITTVLSSDMNMQWSENQVTIFSIFRTMYHQYEIDKSFANASRTDRVFDESTDGYGLRHSARFWNTLIQLGGQVENSQGFGPNTSSNYNNWSTSVKGWSATIEQKLFDDAVTLDAGYRKDKKHIDYSASFSPTGSASAQATQIAARLKAGRDVGLAPAKVMTLGARWKINDIFALNGRYFDGEEGTSGDFDIVTLAGAPLHAEAQKRKEFAIEASPWPYLKPMLTWFDIDIKNQKTATTTTYVVDGQTFYYYTESDTKRRGLELLIKGDITPQTSYSFAWTRMLENSSTTSSGVTTENNGYQTPKNLYTARLSHEWGDYRANLSVKQVSAYSASTSSPGTFAGQFGDYTRVDANLVRDFKVDGHKITGTLYGRNLGNDHYATKYVTGYYYDRGRTIGLELAAEF